MQEPEIDNGRLNDVSTEGADGLSLPDLSDLMQAGGAGEGADHQIDPEFPTTQAALEQAWSEYAACDRRAAEAGFAATDAVKPTQGPTFFEDVKRAGSSTADR